MIKIEDIRSGEWQIQYDNKDAAIRALSDLINEQDQKLRVLHLLARDCGMLMYRLIRALESFDPSNELTTKVRGWLNDHPECAGSIIRYGVCRVELPNK